jgi:ABC-2 type transport system permease protein
VTAMTAERSLGFGNVVRSEWTKLRSLRSTIVCVVFVVMAMLGIAVLMGARWAHQSGPIVGKFDPTNVSLSGVYIAELVVGALGVLVISSEYGTGMIRASFAAVPQRRAVLTAKVIVVSCCSVLLGELTSFASFTVCQALLSPKGVGVSLSDPGALRAVFGTGLYFGATTVLGFGLGAAIRHTAGALSTFFAVLFAPSALVDLLPTSLRNDLINYMPANAGSQIFTVNNSNRALGPWQGLGVFCLYAAAALIAGIVLVGARDT